MEFEKHKEVLRVYDSSDVTMYWSETYVVYDNIEDETYYLRIDQDGGEEIIDVIDGKEE